ncbi:hypothetical protein LXL04_000430 [Taraxacum kok-saghyz]
MLETNKEDEEEDQFHEEEIEVCEERDLRNLNDPENNIVEEVAEIEEVEEENATASVLSKKWQKWRRKQKKNPIDSNGVLSSSTLPVKKPMSRKYRKTQSEIADYGFGRRSCDVDPRFSLDAGRISFDDPRNSIDERRASWDGYLIGRTFPRLPPMVEDVPVVQVPRSDMQISVEEPANVDPLVPGGSIQTREYYTDSSSKRKKSRRWRWKLWGFIHRRGGNKDDDDNFSRVNGVERSYSESWQDRTESKGGFNKKVLRSNSSVSWRNSSSSYNVDFVIDRWNN